jgi:hypothetical protein
VAEWLKAHAWKACLRQKRNVGSNPTLSANHIIDLRSPVFKILAFLKKRDDLTLAQFKDYYENHHVPLILKLTHTPLVYKRNYLDSTDPFSLKSDVIRFDVVTEQIFSSRADMQDWIAKLSTPDNAQVVREDEARFLDHSHYFAYVIDEHVTTGNYP